MHKSMQLAVPTKSVYWVLIRQRSDGAMAARLILSVGNNLIQAKRCASIKMENGPMPMSQRMLFVKCRQMQLKLMVVGGN